MFALIIANRRGFSLVELLAVVAIIGVLALIGIPQYQKFKIKGRQAEAKTMLAAIRTAQVSFHTEFDSYHSSLRVLGVAPLGKMRYNVGFASANPSLPPQAPQDMGNLTTKSMCSGAYGTGVDSNCTVDVDVPDILLIEASVSATEFTAVALSYEDALLADGGNQSLYFMLAAELLIPAAMAGPGKIGSPTGGSVLAGNIVDSWYVNNGHLLFNRKLNKACVLTGKCDLIIGDGNTSLRK